MGGARRPTYRATARSLRQRRPGTSQPPATEPHSATTPAAPASHKVVWPAPVATASSGAATARNRIALIR